MSGRACAGVDVGGTTTRVAVVEQGKVVRRLEEPTLPAGIAEQIVTMLRALQGISMPVGVAVPGPLSADGREVAFTGNVGLRSYPLAELLERELTTDVRIDDDANCAALAEARYGAAADVNSSVTVVIGTGVGAGIVLDGVLLRGAHRTAGELGHIQVEPQGRECSCGRHGCLEAVANGAALAERAERAPDAASVFAAARRGDASAANAIEVTAGWIAVGVAAVASVIDPECVVLAGGVGRQPEIVTLVRRFAPSLCIEPIGDSLEVRGSALGDDAGVIGAALVAGGREGIS